MSKPKFTPQGFGSYIVHPDGSIKGKHGWRGYVENEVKPVLNKDGYLEVRMTENNRRRKWKLHKLICEIFHGPRPGSNFQVCHLDGNKLNNSAGNLKWGTAKENAADRSRHGKTSRGYTHGRAISEAVKRSKMSDTLIAAAPEMYEAMENAIAWYERNVLPVERHRNKELSEFTPAWVDNFNSVLAKARGES